MNLYLLTMALVGNHLFVVDNYIFWKHYFMSFSKLRDDTFYIILTLYIVPIAHAKMWNSRMDRMFAFLCVLLMLALIGSTSSTGVFLSFAILDKFSLCLYLIYLHVLFVLLKQMMKSISKKATVR
jgi:hypothetical protein